MGKSQKTFGYSKLILYIKQKYTMGKMKEKFLEEQQQANFDLQDRMIDDEYCCEQQCCHEENEANANRPVNLAASYDAWWDSLTDDQKEQLFKDRDASERGMADEDFFGPNKTWGV